MPIHGRAGERLELKSLAALAEPETIAREAVAMLNSVGGNVWIGIKEGQDQNEVEPIPEAEAERKRRRLQDHLLDVIEPTPVGREVSVTAVPVEREKKGGGRVLRVELNPLPERRPYALLGHRRGRHFLRRFADRIVPMSREEIFKAGQGASTSSSADAARRTLLQETARLVAQPAARFWLGLEPERAGALNLRRLGETELLEDPTLSGTPRGSFNFTAAAYLGRPRRTSSGGRTALTMGDDALSLRVLRSGGIRFQAALQNLWAGGVPFVDADRLLSPEALLGYPISVLRLEGKLLEETSLWDQRPEGDLWAALAITGLQGWGLLPGNLAEWPMFRYQISRFPEKNLRLQEPLRFAQSDLRERPDDCGMRLVERVYDAFGIDRLPSSSSATLGHAGLPALGGDGYSRWVSLDLGGGIVKPARLRVDNIRPSRFEWETADGDLIPADGRWVHGWRCVE